MKFDLKLMNEIVDGMDEGIIILDNESKIAMANNKAKEILGIILNKDNDKTHPSGKLKQGDIVIVADNCLGADDGGMTPEDLKLINIDDDEIIAGDMVVGVGTYMNDDISAKYKYFHRSDFISNLELETDYLGFHIKVVINTMDNNIHIMVNGVEFLMSYFSSVGDIVVIDSQTGQIKFYQDRGYTIRKETLKDILLGREYSSKGEQKNDIDIIGQRFNDIAEYDILNEEIEKLLSGEADASMEDFFNINKRLLLCNMSPIRDEEITKGLFLMIQDASKLEEILNHRNRILEQIEIRQDKQLNMATIPQEDVFPNFTGSSPVLKKVKYLAAKAANNKANVLITGESGTGKSKLAYDIHKLYRPNSPFVEVNCASIPHGLFESELFGYEKGAFTGASESGKPGYFELANGGTIFLDEIGEIPLEIQVKLLQVLQTKRLYRLGSSSPVQLDVRVITATNSNLNEAVKSGAFRQDLYYRLNVYPIWIPPLRERKSDIYILINTILKKVSEEYGIQPKYFSGAALSKLIAYNWPGNVRELENVIERAVSICEGKTILPEFVDIFTDGTSVDESKEMSLKERIEITEKHAIEEALLNSGGNRSSAMQALDLSKSTFYEKLAKYNLN